MIRLFVNNVPVSINLVEFSDGAIQYTIDPSVTPEKIESVHFSVDPTTDAGKVMEHIRVLYDAYYSTTISFVATNPPTIYLPYLPYGRADRRFSETGSFGLELFLSALCEDFRFETVTVADPHNRNVIPAHWKIIEPVDCFRSSNYRLFNNSYTGVYDAVISPDKGAVGRANQVAHYLNLPLIVCGKDRDAKTGKLSNPRVEQNHNNIDLNGAKLLIVDDIFDGGYTFFQLGNALKELGVTKLDLYVSHLIAAKGLDILSDVIDNVYCYNIVGKYITDKDVINFNNRVRS
jgi:ribose-phosphate pyrophosphokinase